MIDQEEYLISYANLKSNATSITEYLKIDKKEKPITTLPINYSFGLSIIKYDKAYPSPKNTF